MAFKIPGLMISMYQKSLNKQLGTAANSIQASIQVGDLTGANKQAETVISKIKADPMLWNSIGNKPALLEKLNRATGEGVLTSERLSALRDLANSTLSKKDKPNVTKMFDLLINNVKANEEINANRLKVEEEAKAKEKAKKKNNFSELNDMLLAKARENISRNIFDSFRP
jgi:hypothetical protein